jgi:hypothetical protein
VATMAICVLAAADSARAQNALASVASPNAAVEARFVQWQNATPQETEGTLIADGARRTVRFEHDRHVLFEVPYQTITQLHLEQSSFPTRAWHRASYYCTIESLAQHLSVRVLSVEALRPVLTAIELGTGLVADHSTSLRLRPPLFVAAPDATPSVTFESLAGHVPSGRTVYIETNASEGGYQSFKDRIVSASPDAVILADHGAMPRDRVLALWDRDAHRGAGALRGFLIGLAIGVGVDRVIVRSIGADQSFRKPDAALAAIVGGFGAAIGASGRPRDRLLFQTPAIRF